MLLLAVLIVAVVSIILTVPSRTHRSPHTRRAAASHVRLRLVHSRSGNWTFHTYTHAEAVAIDGQASRSSHLPICPKIRRVPPDAPACVASVEGMIEAQMTPQGYANYIKYGPGAVGAYGP